MKCISLLLITKDKSKVNNDTYKEVIIKVAIHTQTTHNRFVLILYCFFFFMLYIVPRRWGTREIFVQNNLYIFFL